MISKFISILKAEGLFSAFSRVSAYFLKILAFFVFVRIKEKIEKKERLCFIDRAENDEIRRNLLQFFKEKKYNYLNLKKISMLDLHLLCTSKYIVCSSELIYYGKLLSKNQIVINIWHAAGAFKKFGYLMENATEKFNNSQLSFVKKYGKTSYIVCSSQHIRDVYADSMCIDKSCAIPLGSIQTDLYFDTQRSSEIRNDFYRKYPWAQRKKIYFFAPTFRENPFRSKFKMNFLSLVSQMKEDEMLIVKLHPNVLWQYRYGGLNWNELTNLPFLDKMSPSEKLVTFLDEDSHTLTLICNVFITDYSSTIFNALLLNKPCVFYAEDLDDYERGFNFDFRQNAPCEILETPNPQNLINAIRTAKVDTPKYTKFKQHHLEACDGNSSERIAEFIHDVVDGKEQKYLENNS